MKNNKSFIHEFSLFYLFTLGGSLFTFGKCGILCIVFAAVFGVLTLFAAYLLKDSKNTALLFFLAVICILNGIYTFGKFVYFIKKKQLFFTPVIFIALIFSAVVIYLFLSGKKAIYKFSLICFILCVAFWALLFCTTVKNADFYDIKYALDFDLKESARVYFILFFPVIIPVFWSKTSFKTAALGSGFAAVTLLIFVALTYCTFGKINTRLNSPILALVDTANVGRVFTRLDAFLLAIIYLSCLIRCAVSFKAFFEISATFNHKKARIRLTKN